MRRFVFFLVAMVALILIAAVISEGAQKTICWTAPGDDGDVGIASTYDIRWFDQPITEANWEMCHVFTDVPVPDTAGTTQCFTFERSLLPEGTVYIGIKTADEIPNWSDI